MEEGETRVRELDYLQGRREAVSRSVEHGIEVLEVGGERAPIPDALHAQSRLAARHRVPLDMVLRRLSAGKTILTHFMLEEAARVGLSNPAFLHAAVESLEISFDRILVTAQKEYRREESYLTTSPDARALRAVQRLLDGEAHEWSLTNYSVEGNHLGLVARCPDARALIRSVANSIGIRSLVLMPSHDEAWGWLGSSAPINLEIVREALTAEGRGPSSIGIGRSEANAAGWRLTHRQAKAALSIGANGAITVYEDVALLVAMSQDSLLTTSLRSTYLMPLSIGRGQGRILRATLRAYFAADRNGSSAAAMLGVSRQTIANRLQRVEALLNRPLTACVDQLQAALLLEELGIVAAEEHEDSAGRTKDAG